MTNDIQTQINDIRQRATTAQQRYQVARQQFNAHLSRGAKLEANRNAKRGTRHFADGEQLATRDPKGARLAFGYSLNGWEWAISQMELRTGRRFTEAQDTPARHNLSQSVQNARHQAQCARLHYEAARYQLNPRLCRAGKVHVTGDVKWAYFDLERAEELLDTKPDNTAFIYPSAVKKFEAAIALMEEIANAQYVPAPLPREALTLLPSTQDAAPSDDNPARENGMALAANLLRAEAERSDTLPHWKGYCAMLQRELDAIMARHEPQVQDVAA